jgi:cyanophycinase
LVLWALRGFLLDERRRATMSQVADAMRWTAPVAALCAIGLLLTAARAGRGDAPGASPPSCRSIFYQPVGAVTPPLTHPHGPGLVLMGGGTDVDAAFAWVQKTIAGGAAGGDFVVLRASGDNDYDAYIHGLAKYDSVRTVLLPPCASAADIGRAAAIAQRADAVFFAGGDQADYVRWKGTPLAAAVRSVYGRGGVVGGTSAGLAILGQYAFDAVAADATHDVHTADAVADPYEKAISFTTGFFDFPPLVDTITDTHFATRDRLGRLAVFMARLIADGATGGKRIRAIGVQQRSALVVDARGTATLLLQGSGGRALFLESGPAKRIAAGKPFVSSSIDAVVIDRQGQHFDLWHWCGDGRRYAIVVDGTAKPMYSPADPYVAPADSRPASCTVH